MQSLFTLDELTLVFPEIYGISTSMRHVKLGFRLQNHPDFEIDYFKDISMYGTDSLHAAYLLTFKDDESECIIIKNRGSKGLYYPKYKQVNYLLCSRNDDEINQEIIHIIRKLKDISLCFVLDTPNQKEIVNFTQLL